MPLWGWFLLILGYAVLVGLFWRNRQVTRRAAQAERDAARHFQARVTLSDEVSALEQRLRQIEATTHDAVLAVDEYRHVTALNPVAQALFGNVVGRSLIEVIRDVDLHQAVQETLTDHRQRTMTITVGLRSYHAQMTNGDGRATLALQDISELYRLQRARRDFVANISHELRTPLTSLGLLCDVLLANAGEGDTGDLVKTIHSEVAELTHLVTDMLDLSQIEDGRMPLRLAPTDVTELVERVVSRLRPQADQRDIALAVEVEPDIRALADADKASRVLTNLVDNAIKYSYQGGVVLLTAHRSPDGRPEGHDIVFTVADEGPGISAADLPRVFERFFKVDRARERGDGVGAGLGLAIARHLVEAHGGRIWATSVEGQGATFYFTLPEA